MQELQDIRWRFLALRLMPHFALDRKKNFVQASKGRLSEQLASIKEESMSVLKDFITRHNVPNDVPDEPDEISSEDDDDGEIPDKVSAKSKKRK